MADSHLHRGTPGPFLRTPGYRTCVDLPSSVAVFGLQDLLASRTEPVHLDFRITFAIVGGFSNQTDDSDSDVEDAILADLKEKWKTVEENGRITDDATLSDILEVNAKLLTASYPTDEEILKSLMDNNKRQENDSYSENEDVIQPKPHRTEMLQSFETIKRGFQMEENVPDSIFSSHIKCENFYENLTSRKAKQCKITEFFK
ncbi:hypothetical protein AVEN_55898-1 [Araneus ventricosus]|uniref:Uncharacterized protein n=1 Tax=Araneus ventricosus TaxID=182803 RepID=A0A4Y2DH59_ARAVE|nr:hypothetical protein AVEN_55898-1 [Araneus ventricosus]